jgi:hypothetical protein
VLAKREPVNTDDGNSRDGEWDEQLDGRTAGDGDRFRVVSGRFRFSSD